MASASQQQLEYYFGDNGTLNFDEFSTTIPVRDERHERTFDYDTNWDRDLRVNTDLTLLPSKLLDLMIDDKVPPQNKQYDFLDAIDRENFREETVSGKDT